MCMCVLHDKSDDEVVGRVFDNGPEDLGSIPGRVLPKTLKIVLDTSLLNSQQYNPSIHPYKPSIYLSIYRWFNVSSQGNEYFLA